MAHPGSHGKKAVKWTCACVLYTRVSRDDAATAATDSSSSAAGPDDDGDMTASTNSEVPKLDLAFKEVETIKTYITVLASAVSVGQTLYLNDETTDWLVAVKRCCTVKPA